MLDKFMGMAGQGRRGLRIVALGLSGLLLLAVCTPAWSQAGARSKQLVIATTSTTSSHYPFTVAVGNVINAAAPAMNPTVVSTEGGFFSYYALQGGEADISMGGAEAGALLFNGVGKYKKFPELRLLWHYALNSVAFVVRADSGIKTIQDLKGKAFNPAGRGTTTELMVTDVLSAVGVTPDYFRAGMGDTLTAFKDGRIVGFAKATGRTTPDAQIMDAMTARPIRILSWSPEQFSQVKAKFNYYGTTTIPPGVYQGDWNTKDVSTFAQLVTYWATTRMSKDDGYAVMKAVMADIASKKSKLLASYKALGEVDVVNLTLKNATVPLHAGAVRWFKENGYTVPDHAIPPEAK